VFEKLAKQRQSPITFKQGEQLAKDLSAVKYEPPAPAIKYAMFYFSSRTIYPILGYLIVGRMLIQLAIGMSNVRL